MAKARGAKSVKATVAKKHKRKSKLIKKKSKNKILKVKPLNQSDVKPSLDTSEGKPKDVKPPLDTSEGKPKDVKPPLDTSDVKPKVENETKDPSEDKKVISKLSSDQFSERFPVFKDEELVKKFLGVTMTNNQKGRIRQTLKDSLKGTSDQLLPDIIHNRVQSIVKETTALTDAELRKIRILYNMLKTTVETQATEGKVKKNKKGKNKKRKNKGNKSEGEVKSEMEAKSETEVKDEMTENIEMKDIVEKPAGDENDAKEKNKSQGKANNCTKGPKRYVVFIGNLPLDIDKERIMQHFKDFKDYIVDVRIPKQKPNKKSGIAYVELKNELCYELALSKHHTMLENKRINVLYTTQKDSKISKAEAKGKAAKLVALQKSGKLAGSIPLNRKRSQRRMKAKQARAKLEAAA